MFPVAKQLCRMLATQKKERKKRRKKESRKSKRKSSLGFFQGGRCGCSLPAPLRFCPTRACQLVRCASRVLSLSLPINTAAGRKYRAGSTLTSSPVSNVHTAAPVNNSLMGGGLAGTCNIRLMPPIKSVPVCAS